MLPFATSATNVKSTATWAIAILLAVIFFGVGVAKLVSHNMFVVMFHALELPRWFMYVTGAIEIVVSVTLMYPRTVFLGAIGVICLMLGALIVHAMHGQFGLMSLPFLLLVLAVTLGWLVNWGVAVRAR